MENTINIPENTTAQSTLLTTSIGDAIWTGILNIPVPKMLFSEFWSQGELSVLFGKDGIGKSLLAVQVADAITKGTPVNGFTTETPAQKVLYFDFSTSDRQFTRRYEGYAFSDNFIRITINPRHWELRKFGEQLVAAIDEAVKEHQATVIIIDSLDTLKFFVNEIFLLSGLMRLKNEMGLSVLLLAGAKKMQPGRALRLGNLAAHKMLAGIAHSIFAMGVTQPEGDNRYLIHLKGNEHGRVYHQNNVIIGRNISPLAQGHGEREVLPGFEFMDYETEEGQLCMNPEGLDAWILYSKEEKPWLSLGEIASELDTNKMRVKRVLDRYYKGVTAVTPNSEFEVGEEELEMEESNTGVFSFSNRGLQAGGKNTPVAQPAKKLSYSQQLRQRLAEARKER